MNERGPRRVLRIGKASFAYRIWKTSGGCWVYDMDCQSQNAGMGRPQGEKFITQEEALLAALNRARRWFAITAEFNIGSSVTYAPEDCKKMVEALNTDGLFGFVEPPEEPPACPYCLRPIDDCDCCDADVSPDMGDQ